MDSEDGWAWIRGDSFFVEKDAYQLTLMEQAGFCEQDGGTLGTYLPTRVRIAFDGHDYLDAVRDDGIWKTTKQSLTSIGGGTLAVVKDLAVAFIKQKAKEQLGLDL